MSFQILRVPLGRLVTLYRLLASRWATLRYRWCLQADAVQFDALVPTLAGIRPQSASSGATDTSAETILRPVIRDMPREREGRDGLLDRSYMR